MKGKIKKFIFVGIVLIMVINLTTLSFATTINTNKTSEDLIEYNKELEKKLREKLESSQTQASKIETEPYTDSNMDNKNGEETPSPSENSDAKFSDFTNAEVTFAFDESTLVMYISGFQKVEGNYCYLYIGSDQSILTTENYDDKISVNELKGENKYRFNLSSKFMSLNKDYYYILEETTYVSNQQVKKVLLSGKVVRPELPPIGSRIDVFMMTKGQCSPFIKVYSTSEYNRKIKYKISKVTDKNLLKKFKTNEGQAFKELLTYAKNGTAVASGTIDMSQTNFNPIDNVKLEKGAYYCAYYELDDENGKYYPLSDAQIYEENNEALCHFAFGDMQFSDDEVDNTSSPSDLPFAGAITIGTFILISVSIVVGIFILNKRYDDVK